jgi:hypothetical protein
MAADLLRTKPLMPAKRILPACPWPRLSLPPAAGDAPGGSRAVRIPLNHKAPVTWATREKIRGLDGRSHPFPEKSSFDLSYSGSLVDFTIPTTDTSPDP